MDNLIDRAELYKHIAELEELARNRVCDTPTNSPAYMRYVAQLNERTYLKHEIADALTIDPVHAAGACYCRECRHKDTNVCPAFDGPMRRTSLRIKHCSEGEPKGAQNDEQ